MDGRPHFEHDQGLRTKRGPRSGTDTKSIADYTEKESALGLLDAGLAGLKPCATASTQWHGASVTGRSPLYGQGEAIRREHGWSMRWQGVCSAAAHSVVWFVVLVAAPTEREFPSIPYTRSGCCRAGAGPLPRVTRTTLPPIPEAALLTSHRTYVGLRPTPRLGRSRGPRYPAPLPRRRAVRA